MFTFQSEIMGNEWRRSAREGFCGEAPRAALGSRAWKRKRLEVEAPLPLPSGQK